MAQVENLAAAVEALHQAYLDVKELTGHQAEAVMHAPTGATYLLPDMQRELRQMERAARQNAEERAAILDALPAQIAILDKEGTITAVNGAWRAFTLAQDYPVASFGIGLSYLAFCHTSSVDWQHTYLTVATGLDQILSGTSVSFTCEYSCPTPQVTLWFLLTIIPLQVGGKTGAVITHLDITERHTARIRETELRQRIERLMDQAGIGVLVNLDNRPIFANSALAKMLDLASKDEILAHSEIRKLFDRPRTEANDITSVKDAPPTANFMPAMLTLHRKDGGSVTFDVRLFSIVWDGSTAACAVFTDVTERLLIESQLRAAQKLEAVGRLTAGVAHDFNNLFTIVLGCADLLHDAVQDKPDLAKLAEQSMIAAERGADLTNRLLAFARLQPLSPQVVNVNQRIVAMEEVLRRTLGSRIGLKMTLSDTLWPAHIDPGEFDNAILNLSINAKDAMPNGGHMSLQTRNVDIKSDSDGNRDIEPGAYVVVSVGDDGTGMSEATQAHIFEPFFTTKDVGEGSGLGLSMIFGFIKQSSGNITVRSALAKGTTIDLYLPKAGAGHA